MRKMLLPLFVLVFAFSASAFAGSITINFEQYSEFTQITNQYDAADNVTFANALQLVAPDYDYYDYPPHSGSGVITNDPNDPLTMTFDAGKGSYYVSGWFSAPDGIIVTAYDSSKTVVGTAFTGSTNQSNASFTLGDGTDLISYVTFSATDGADYLTLDDLSFSPVPEPGMPMLMGTALLAAFGIFIWRRKLGYS